MIKCNCGTLYNTANTTDDELRETEDGYACVACDESMKPDEPLTLFENPKTWEDEWQGMPEYVSKKRVEPFMTATFNFLSQKDFDKFKDFLREHLYGGEAPFRGTQKDKQKEAWFPLLTQGGDYRYVDGDGDES
jgi:hypothetical protein